jgi:predicted  nucleic acid-binding Zn-ribbon protein
MSSSSFSPSLPDNDEYRKLLVFIDSIIEVELDESASPEKRQEATNKTAWAIAESKKSLEEGRHDTPYAYFPQVYTSRAMKLLEAKMKNNRRQIEEYSERVEDYAERIVKLKAEQIKFGRRLEDLKHLFPEYRQFEEAAQKLDDS